MEKLRDKLNELSEENPKAAIFIDTLIVQEDFFGNGRHRLSFNVGASVKCTGDVAKSVERLSGKLTNMADTVRDGLWY